MNALELVDCGLSLRGGEHERVILAHTSLVVPAGAFYLLVGESGSGKSTLLRIWAGLVEPTEPPPLMRGTLRLLGEALSRGFPRALRGRVTAVLQDEGLLDELSPKENVELALVAAGRSKKLALGLLSQAGLEHPPAHVASLSGGMRKRVAVARALAAEPELILFDEPTAGLDPAAARQMAELLVRTQRDARNVRTTIVATHDVVAFDGLADAVLRIEGAKLELLDADAMRDVAARGGGDIERIVPAREDLTLLGLERLTLAIAGWMHTFGEAVLRLPPVFPAVVVRLTARFVLEPLAFVLLAAAAIGGLATFFALQNNPLEGALTAQVLTGCGKVLSAVLVPLLAGVFFTARMAAGAAARIGTMRRTSQTHALLLIGVRPADWLLTPLVWAMAIAMPLTAAAAIVVAALSSLVAARLVAGTTMIGWAEAFFQTVDRADLRFLVLKTVLSGFLVAVLTWHLAMAPKRSGQDVGESVNASIVLGLCTVLLVHAGLTLLQFG